VAVGLGLVLLGGLVDLLAGLLDLLVGFAFAAVALDLEAVADFVVALVVAIVNTDLRMSSLMVTDYFGGLG
jgi:hypothetical protein